MPSRIRCFLLTSTDEILLSLRRFALDGDTGPCGRTAPRYPGGDVVTWNHHDAEISIGRERGTIESSLDGDHTGKTVSIDDARWPERCVCGFVFRADDARQESRSRLYKRSDTGELVTISNAPAGALYDSGSFNDIDGYQRNGPRESIVCKTPAGEWLIDGPASNGPGWTRTGTLPDIVVTPSIGIGSPQRMHGWLGGPNHNEPGWLVIDMP